MSSIRRKLTLVPHLHMLNKATGDNRDPTPGYMYDEVCKITFQSVTACAELEDYLVGRLKKKSPHTKAKALKILKHLVEKGHDGFRQDLQRRTEEIREAQSYKGPADALHGDSFNQLVRNNAKDLMEALFNTQDTAPRVAPGQRPTTFANDHISNTASRGAASSSRSSGSKISSSDIPSYSTYSGGAGPSSSSGSGYFNEGATGASGKKMWGYGNTPMKEEKEASSLMAMVKQGTNIVKQGINKVAEKIPDSIRKDRGAEPRIGGTRESPATTRYSTHQRDAAESFRLNSGPAAPRYAPPEPTYTPPSVSSSGTSDPQPTVTKDSAYEQRLVQEICAPGGVRVAPQPSALSAFVQKCSSLDCHKIVELLGNELDGAETDKACLRVLYVIEALANSDIVGISECMIDLEENLEDLAEADAPKLRAKAGKVLRLCVPGAGSGAPAPAAQPHAQAPPANNGGGATLLDFGAPSEPAPAPAPSAGGSLFSGMQVSSSAAAPAEPPAPVQAAAGGGLFAGMNVGAPAAASQPAAPPAQQPSLVEGLGGLLLGDTPAPAASSTPTQPVAAPQEQGTGDLMWEEPSTAAAFDPLAALGGSAVQPQPQPPSPGQPLLGSPAVAPQQSPMGMVSPHQPLGMVSPGMRMGAGMQLQQQPNVQQHSMMPMGFQPMAGTQQPRPAAGMAGNSFGANPITRSDAFNFVATEMHGQGGAGGSAFSNLLGGGGGMPPTQPAAPAMVMQPQAGFGQVTPTRPTQQPKAAATSPSGGAFGIASSSADAFSFVAAEVDRNKSK